MSPAAPTEEQSVSNTDYRFTARPLSEEEGSA